MLALLLAGPLAPLLAAAPSPAWVPFDAPAWQALQAGARPLAVVFTTTDCEYCPAVIAQLREHFDAGPAPRPRLAVVVMDADNVTPDLAQGRYYRLADERLVFRGAELPLRHAVNPRWRGETPYLALLPAEGAPRYVLGRPTAADLAVLEPPARTAPRPR